MNVSSEVDFDEIASKTDGFSGADLQALLYNAHLEVIHSVIAETSLVEVTDDKDSKKEQKPVKYFTFGGGSDKVVLSKAEESAMQTRVKSHSSVGFLVSSIFSVAANSIHFDGERVNQSVRPASSEKSLFFGYFRLNLS